MKAQHQRSAKRTASAYALRIAIAASFAAGAALIGSGLYIQAKAQFAQFLIARAFASPPEELAKPWPWADVEPVALIQAPRIKAASYALSGTSGEALAFGPGHMHSTAQPGGYGTAVYAAHRDTHFAWLGELQAGDEIEVSARDGRQFTYRVTRSWIAPYDNSGIDPDTDRRLLALVTCWPLDATTRGDDRYIVEAELVPDDRLFSEGRAPASGI